jgi:hypothetical protein
MLLLALSARASTKSYENLVDVVVIAILFGQFWFSRVLCTGYGYRRLFHCLSTANHVQPRARLNIGSHVLMLVLLLLEKLRLLLIISIFYCILLLLSP